jgi:hypothetical protein
MKYTAKVSSPSASIYLRALGLGPFNALNFLTDSHYLGAFFPRKSLVFPFGTLGGVEASLVVATLDSLVMSCS